MPVRKTKVESLCLEFMTLCQSREVTAQIAVKGRIKFSFRHQGCHIKDVFP